MPNQLTKKIGPLPAWAWVAGGLLFVGMVWYLRRNAGGSSTVSTTDTTDGTQIGGSLPDSGGDFTGGLGSGGGGYAGDPVYSGGTPVGMPPDFWDSFLASLPTYTPSPIWEDPRNPVDTNPIGPAIGPAPVLVKTAPTKQTSFIWDGVTYTAKDEAKFRAYLKSKGLSYKSWASKHSKAAMDVFGKMA